MISIDDAVYGEYDVTCDDDCCSPLPGENIVYVSVDRETMLNKFLQ